MYKGGFGTFCQRAFSTFTRFMINLSPMLAELIINSVKVEKHPWTPQYSGFIRILENLEFYCGISQDFTVLENDTATGPGMFWKSVELE